VAVAVERTAVAVATSTTAVVAAERAKKKEVLSIEVLKPKIETSTDGQTHFINSLVCPCVRLSVEVPILGFGTSMERWTDGHDLLLFFLFFFFALFATATAVVDAATATAVRSTVTATPSTRGCCVIVVVALG
jgi:hypothetical protein